MFQVFPAGHVGTTFSPSGIVGLFYSKMAELFWLLFEKKKILHSSLCCFITCLKMPMCLSLPVFSLATAVYLGFDQCV